MKAIRLVPVRKRKHTADIQPQPRSRAQRVLPFVLCIEQQQQSAELDEFSKNVTSLASLRKYIHSLFSLLDGTARWSGISFTDVQITKMFEEHDNDPVRSRQYFLQTLRENAKWQQWVRENLEVSTFLIDATYVREPNILCQLNPRVIFYLDVDELNTLCIVSKSVRSVIKRFGYLYRNSESSDSI